MSNSSFPWFQFYARDWLTDVMVRAMPLAVRGAYIELLALQWENGGLPKDPEQVRQLLGIHDESFPSWWDQLERHFPVVSEDWLTERRNLRLEKLREEKLAKRAAQSAGGRSTVAKRRATHGANPAVRASDKTDADSDAEKSKNKTSVRKRTGGGYLYPAAFDRLWNRYPARNDKRVGKRATYKRWNKLADVDKSAIFIAAGHYAQSKIARVDGKARDPERFLKDDYWRDWLDGPGTDVHVEERDRIPKQAPQAPQGGPPVDPDDVAAELGHGSFLEATRALSMDERLKKEEGKS